MPSIGDRNRNSIRPQSVRIALSVLVSIVAGVGSNATAQADFVYALAADPVVEGTFKVGVTVVGTGVADAAKYAGADLVAYTKQANDYASTYSKDYMTTVKYKISYTLDAGKATLDPDNSTITFTNAAFTTLPISLTKVTGDFEKNMFTSFEFKSLAWYPDLEKKYAIKQDTLQGTIDLTDPKKPVVNMTAAYLWQEKKKDSGVILQPAAKLTYTMTYKDLPGDGDPWDPTPAGPASVPEPASLTLLLFGLGSFVLASARGRRTKATC